MDLQKYIQQKVKLFTNPLYFQYFSKMLVDITKNKFCYIKCLSISNLIDGVNNPDIFRSKWYIIFQLIFNKTDKKLKNKQITLSNSPLWKINSNTNYIVYCYIKKLCKKKIKLLIPIAIKENTSLLNMIKLYIDLCEQEMHPKKKFRNLVKIQKSPESSKTSKNPSRNPTILQNSNSKNTFNLNDVQKKYGIGKNKFSYANSICRLFIGETDENTVKLKFLSNISVKKEQKFKINSLEGIGNCSGSYVKNLLSDVYKSKGAYNGIIIDQDMVNVLEKFNKEQKFMEDCKSKELLKSNSKKNYGEKFEKKI